MNKLFRNTVSIITALILLVVGTPMSILAEGSDSDLLFSYDGSSFNVADWVGTNNSPTVNNNGLSLQQCHNTTYATVTYKENYDLSHGFELTYSATGRQNWGNIYSDTYYVGVKIGNLTVAMNHYINPVIMVDDSVKVKGSPIISASGTSDIRIWLTNEESKFGSVTYTVSYDAADKTVTYTKYHDEKKAFEISYTDTANALNLSNAQISLYHGNSWSFNATYKNIALYARSEIPDLSTLPGGSCGDNANWAFDKSTGTLYITGEGEMDNYVNVGNIAPWSEQYRTQITRVVIDDGITHIGNRAFKGHNRITSVKLGAGVKTMGYECFYLCNKLEKIQLNEGLTNLGALTFYGCTSLTNVVIPTTVTNIENRAFKGSGLTSVVVPDTVTKMGYEVFMNCANLASVDFTEGISMLQPCTFQNCTSLTRFVFTENMCRIRSNAFNGCSALREFIFVNAENMWGSSNGQEAKIASNAFGGCAASLTLIAQKGSHVELYAYNKGFSFAENLTDGEYEKYSGTRDPWLWPFAATSIWNMPIGSNAILEKANFRSEYCITIDDEYLVKVPAGSPIVEVYSPSSWRQRWPGNKYEGTMQIPADFYLADSTSNSTPNNCAAFLMPDGRTIRQLEPCCRLETGNARIVGYLHDEDQDIYGEGIKGTHYGSGLSAIGGSIRLGELTSDEPIRHALKLNVYAKNYLYYDQNAKKGYIWPADRHDSYAGNSSNNNAYGGTNPKLRMGTLLTIPQNVTPESLGITTKPGKKLFYALQNYGCYIVDDSAWSCYAWSAEAGVRDEVQNKLGIDIDTTSTSSSYYKDCIALITNLYIVTNNSPTSIGGGGTPCKPLAPDFAY